ncbi:MAG TPA: L,D-transpeptidase [Solirubrobacteraceae bacterium]|nr:L,D-transpeptidase [Solirubrobacteraceae bacterium]
MDAGWHRRSKAGALGGALGTTLLAAAAAVLVASATGGLGPRSADAATTTGVPASAPVAAAQSHSPSIITVVLKRRLGRTELTHLPTAVAIATRGIAIRLNGKPAASTARPTLSPATAGTWTDVGNYEFFRPASTLEPCTSYTMRIPAGTLAKDHRALGKSRTISFGVACPGTMAVQEALARLGYLPYTLHGFVGASDTGPISRAQAAHNAYELPHGILRANVAGAPPLTMGTLDPATTGAIEVFEGNHNLPVSTTITKQFWTDLIADETLAKRDPHPYTWVTVTETLPETLEVHENGRVALTSPTNTGVPGAATQQGIFPIYVRYVATTMIGTNVDGSHYDDPGVPWVNYFNGGDAVHGYPRPGYGYPQSNGCVELPITTAQSVYGMLQVGDLVIVE